MLLCVGNFFGSTSEAEWAEYRTGAKKGKEGGWCYRGGWHCFTARLRIQEPRLGTVVLKQLYCTRETPPRKERWVCLEHPCIILELILHKQGRVMWMEQRLFTTCNCGSIMLGTHSARGFLVLCLLLPKCAGGSDWLGFPAVISGQCGLGLVHWN